ncbi:hypothetical protein GCM10007147_10530 [Nocardiopsis kunsanensis]|uniref:Uncharacterized protein n=1 Tax=Nocardiopsis kunsanensis TaxID=141693 RepID=A0A918X9J6_9ACTN|nr:hypothetical protein GCM10007147_10530 [Nocardiopsis kunsanensis]
MLVLPLVDSASTFWAVKPDRAICPEVVEARACSPWPVRWMLPLVLRAWTGSYTWVRSRASEVVSACIGPWWLLVSIALGL